jgi:hypothetical protein
MSASGDLFWTHDHFAQMSWHDNHVHALRIVSGEYGTGQLILDLDYILEWVKDSEGGCRFLIVPATLTFHEVTDLRVTIDYAASTAALGPFSLDRIDRWFEKRDRYEAQLWALRLNWPAGGITFASRGYEQRGVGAPVLSDEQWLSGEVRSSTR